jgi:replicative DNA helicase
MADPPRTLPHNLDAEYSVLGGILLNPKEALNQVLQLLDAEDFYSPAHQEIFRAIIALEEANRPIDIITLEEQLRAAGQLSRVGGVTALAELSGRVPTVENIGFHARIVQDKATIRRLIRTCAEVVAEAYTDPTEVQAFLDGAEQQVFELSQRSTTDSYRQLKPILEEVFLTIQKRWEKKQKITGVPTGYDHFDRLTCGLQPGDLIIVAARPSMGKTSFCLNIAHNSATRFKVPVLVFSLEMNQESLVERILSGEAHIDSSKLRAGFLEQEEWKNLTSAAGRISEAPIYIDDSAAPTVLELRAKARRFRADRTIFSQPDQMGLVIVDYLQLVRARKSLDSREREVAEVSRGLKALAKEIKLPVIALSQLRRGVEDRKDQRPQLSDLRESGAIEQDADVICFIHRSRSDDKDEEYDPRQPRQAELIIGKQRNGPLGSVPLMFIPQYTRFESHAREE